MQQEKEKEVINKLRKTHPNLFVGYLIFGLWAISLGLAIILNTSDSFHLFTGVMFILSGVAQLFGIEYAMPIARFGMVVSIIFGMAVGVMIFLGKWDKIPGVQIIMWVGFAVLQLAPLSEPSINPVTKKNKAE